jgi:hypothetical protein
MSYKENNIMSARFPKGYVKFESKMLGNLENEWRRTGDEGLRTLILMNRQILEIYWDRREEEELVQPNPTCFFCKLIGK